MTNRIALGLGLLIAAALAVDARLNGAQATLFLARKLLDLVEWMAFWR